MFERIEIEHYRSCLATVFSPQPDLSVLIGPNGSGKTNVLQSLLLLKRLCEDRPDFGNPRPETKEGNETHLKAHFSLESKRAILSADLQLDTDENNVDVVQANKQSWYVKDFTGNAKRIAIPLAFAPLTRGDDFGYQRMLFREYSHRYYGTLSASFDIPDEFIRPFAAIADYLANIKYYSASQFTNPSQCPVSIEIEKDGQMGMRARRLGGHAKFIFDLYTEFKASNSLGYKQFFDVIGPSGIGLVDEIHFKEIPTSSVDYTVHSGGRLRERKREKSLLIPQFIIGRNALSPNQLSEGTFKTITLLFYLMTEKSSALLIEEPEVCVHHGLLSSIVELIKSYSSQKQIVLSTHSDFILDKMEPRHVYKVVRDPDVGTVVTHITDSMSANELKALKDYLATEGNLGEYWKHGALE